MPNIQPAVHSCGFCGASVTDADQHAEYDCPVSKRKLDRLVESLARSTAPVAVEPDDDVVVIEPPAKRPCMRSEEAPVQVELPAPNTTPIVVPSATPVSDSPHVQRAMAKLQRVLRRVKSKKQNRNASGKASRSTFSTNFQLGLGRSCGALGAKSFETPHNFKKGVGVYMQDIQTSSRAKWKRALWVAAKELLLEIDADFAEHDDFCVNFSKMTDGSLHWVRKHVDGRDIAHQYGIVLGDNQGGELQAWNSDGTSQLVDYRHAVLKMDGRLPHAVLPFEGERYCVIFYKLYDRNLTQPLPIFEPARII